MSTETPSPEPETETPEPSVEVERIPEPGSGSILQPARFGFDPKQIEAIRQTVAKDCTDAELVMFLEVCGRYELDPFAKQIYAAKMSGQSGGISIIVSRDGLLAHAHKQQDFIRMDGDVVCKGDQFQMDMVAGDRTVTHSYSDPSNRGEVIGAWAVVVRREHGETYFYAPMEEYKKNSPIWTKHPSAMILKCAESYALRKAYSISGVVGENEVDTSTATNLTSIPGKANDLHPDWGDDPQLATDLRDAVTEARKHWPEKWLDAKLNALLHGTTDEKRRELLDEIRRDLAEVVQMPEEDVVDAVVVEESDTPSESPSEPPAEAVDGIPEEGLPPLPTGHGDPNEDEGIETPVKDEQ